MTLPIEQRSLLEAGATQNCLVAFLDILGTKEMVRRGEFDAGLAYDFVNAAGIAARFFSRIRVAAFSDSVLVSALPRDAASFLDGLAFMHRHWFGDGIPVRGGIALGAIEWAHSAGQDRAVQSPNFFFARVFGPAVVEAVALEQKAGAGALCMASEQSARLLREVDPAAIFASYANILVWANPAAVGWHLHHFRTRLEGSTVDSEEWRHNRATAWYFEQLQIRRQALTRTIPATTVEPDEWLEIDVASA
jgi:hypothetical protein